VEIGVKIGPGLDRTLITAAQESERLGFDSVWLSERVVTPFDKPHPYDPMIDPWIGLSFVAAVTGRVKLGTSVSQIALRPPVLMARELATLDRLSGGRLIVGAGAGWVEEEFTSTGVPFETRGGRLNEFIRVLRHLWTVPEEPWDGKHFMIPALGIVKPVSEGGPPIYVGAGGPAGLRRAARYGDGFICTTIPPEQVTALRKRLDEHRAAAGRSGPFPFFVQAMFPSSVDKAKDMVSRFTDAGADGLILTCEEPLPGALTNAEDVVRALLDAASRAAA
jgi:probable F420-dependent oxidoreductase